jgi:hypothetical protein
MPIDGAPTINNGQVVHCSMGGQLTLILTDPREPATAIDCQPGNLVPAGMCRSPQNPQVAAATAAALGSLMPQPCNPMICGLWRGVSINAQSGVPPWGLLMPGSQAQCTWGGVITVG